MFYQNIPEMLRDQPEKNIVLHIVDHGHILNFKYGS